MQGSKCLSKRIQAKTWVWKCQFKCERMHLNKESLTGVWNIFIHKLWRGTKAKLTEVKRRHLKQMFFIISRLILASS